MARARMTEAACFIISLDELWKRRHQKSGLNSYKYQKELFKIFLRSVFSVIHDELLQYQNFG